MKNILIIGGSYGIGWSLAQILSTQHRVYIAARTAPNTTTDNIHYIPFDAANDTLDIAQLPSQLDGFVYCPGSILLKPFRSIKKEHFTETLDINFLQMIPVLQQVVPLLTTSQQSSIVLFSSIAAQTGMPFHTSIAAAKGAIEGFSKAFAAEYAPKIRINVIAPSLTQTPLSEKLLNSEQKIEKSAERHPLKKVGQPEDIAEMAAFLLSEKSQWITGQIIHVDGGLSTISV